MTAFDWLELFVAILAAMEVGLIARTLSTLLWRDLRARHKSSGPSGDYPYLVLLLPALEEQPIVGSTVSWFSRLEYPTDKLQVIIVTTEKEAHQYNLRGHDHVTTTSELVRKEIATANTALGTERFRHVHYPQVDGGKSAQLNFAVQQLSGFMPHRPAERVYVGVYDFDSRPALETLAETARAATDGAFPDVLQQVPVPLKNIASLSQRPVNSLLILHGIRHMTRAIGIETFRLLLVSTGVKFVPLYCMGAGMFVRLDTLQENGCFPEPVDDIPLGYRYTLNGLRFAPILPFNLVDLPPQLRGVFNQRVLIFKGVLGFLPELLNAWRRRRRFASPQIVSVFVEGCTNVFELTLWPWIVLAYLLWAALSSRFGELCWLMLLLPYAHSLTGLVAAMSITKVRVPARGVPTFVLAIVASPLAQFWGTFGSWIYLYRALRSWIVGEEVPYTKTKRVADSTIDNLSS